MAITTSSSWNYKAVSACMACIYEMSCHDVRMPSEALQHGDEDIDPAVAKL